MVTQGCLVKAGSKIPMIGGCKRSAGQRELVLNNYPLLLQAAVAGQGVALGWEGLCDEALASGTLVALKDFGHATAHGFALIEVNPAEHSQARQALIEWIKASFEAPVNQVSQYMARPCSVVQVSASEKDASTYRQG